MGIGRGLELGGYVANRASANDVTGQTMASNNIDMYKRLQDMQDQDTADQARKALMNSYGDYTTPGAMPDVSQKPFAPQNANPLGLTSNEQLVAPTPGRASKPIAQPAPAAAPTQMLQPAHPHTPTPDSRFGYQVLGDALSLAPRSGSSRYQIMLDETQRRQNQSTGAPIAANPAPVTPALATPAPVIGTNPQNGATQATPTIDNMITAAATRHGIPLEYARSLVHVESRGDPNAISPKGAKGLGQLMDGTAADMGVTNPFDPQQNLEGSFKFLAHLYQKTGNWHDAFAMYNAGPNNPNFRAAGGGYASTVINGAGQTNPSMQTAQAAPPMQTAQAAPSMQATQSAPAGFSGTAYSSQTAPVVEQVRMHDMQMQQIQRNIQALMPYAGNREVDTQLAQLQGGLMQAYLGRSQVLTNAALTGFATTGDPTQLVQTMNAQGIPLSIGRAQDGNYTLMNGQGQPIPNTYGNLQSMVAYLSQQYNQALAAKAEEHRAKLEELAVTNQGTANVAGITARAHVLGAQTAANSKLEEAKLTAGRPNFSTPTPSGQVYYGNGNGNVSAISPESTTTVNNVKVTTPAQTSVIQTPPGMGLSSNQTIDPRYTQ